MEGLRLRFFPFFVCVCGGGGGIRGKAGCMCSGPGV